METIENHSFDKRTWKQRFCWARVKTDWWIKLWIAGLWVKVFVNTKLESTGTGYQQQLWGLSSGENDIDLLEGKAQTNFSNLGKLGVVMKVDCETFSWGKWLRVHRYCIFVNSKILNNNLTCQQLLVLANFIRLRFVPLLRNCRWPRVFTGVGVSIP